MARAVWSGALTFGLVSLPVRMYAATESHTVHFHQIQRGTSDRIRNRRVNERTGKEVAAEDIVKGLDVGDGYVVVEPEELEDIAPGRSRALDISGFVDLDEVAPIFFDQTYYLGPKGKDYAKVYTLLHRALARSNKAGIATFVMRNREYLVAVNAEGDLLVLHTLHWADEVRDPWQEVPDLPTGTDITDREMTTAKQLIEALSTEWNPDDYHDVYQEHVRRLIEAKSKGETVEKAAEPPESTNVVDLMSVLQQSVESARGRRSRGKSGAGAKGATRRKSTAKAAGGKSAEAGRKAEKKEKKSGNGKESVRAAASGKGRGKGGGKAAAKAAVGDLEKLSKAELYERATRSGVRGRSSMSREELIAALTGSDRTTRPSAA